MVNAIKEAADKLLQKTYVLYKCLGDPNAPWYVKLLVGFIVAYILSPIDIIPDFIPVIGLLDEAILVPIGIALALKLMPDEIVNRYSNTGSTEISKSLVITGIVITFLIWVFAIILVVHIGTTVGD